MTADEMIAALTDEQAAVVVGYATACVVRRTKPNALEAFLEVVGDQTFDWACAFARMWATQRQADKGVTRPDIDAPDLISALPEKLRAWAAQRLASPHFTDPEEAKHSLLMNVEVLRQQQEAEEP